MGDTEEGRVGVERKEEEARVRVGGGWGFLFHPNQRDLRGKGRRWKGLDVPREDFQYLVVLDFEWTCDNRPGFGPLEIIGG